MIAETANGFLEHLRFLHFQFPQHFRKLFIASPLRGLGDILMQIVGIQQLIDSFFVLLSSADEVLDDALQIAPVYFEPVLRQREGLLGWLHHFKNSSANTNSIMITPYKKRKSAYRSTELRTLISLSPYIYLSVIFHHFL